MFEHAIALDGNQRGRAGIRILDEQVRHIADLVLGLVDADIEREVRAVFPEHRIAALRVNPGRRLVQTAGTVLSNRSVTQLARGVRREMAMSAIDLRASLAGRSAENTSGLKALMS